MATRNGKTETLKGRKQRRRRRKLHERKVTFARTLDSKNKQNIGREIFEASIWLVPY